MKTEDEKLSAGQAQPGSIKPLEWTFFGNTRGGAWEANGILGEYRLEPRVDSKEHWMPHVPGTVGPVSYARLSLEDAKAICQSHFDTAIRSALVPPAVPGEVEPDSDDLAVDRFAAAMKAKLAEKRAQGYHGWDDPEQCHIDYLKQLLVKQIHERAVLDPVDIANLSMMIHQRGENPSHGR